MLPTKSSSRYPTPRPDLTSSACPSRVCLVVHYGQRPERNYHTIKELAGLKGRLMQHRRKKELLVARRAICADLGDISQVAHPDIASIQCVYDYISERILIQEYLELSLYQLRPLTETEIASSIAQVHDAFRYLSLTCPPFSLDDVRVSLVGRVKLVINFDFGPHHFEFTNADYWCDSLFRLMVALKPDKMSFIAHDFFQSATQRQMPPSDHPFLLRQSRGPRGLLLSVRRACGIALADVSENVFTRSKSV